MERLALLKMYELERAKVLILRETKGAFNDESLEMCLDLIKDFMKN